MRLDEPKPTPGKAPIGGSPRRHLDKPCGQVRGNPLQMTSGNPIKQKEIISG